MAWRWQRRRRPAWGPAEAVPEPRAEQALLAAERERALEAAEQALEEAGAAGQVAVETIHHLNPTDLTTCLPGTVWDARHQKCFVSRSRVLPASRLTE